MSIISFFESFEDEASFHFNLCVVLALMFALVLPIVSFGIEAPYGRYAVNAGKWWGCLIPGRAAWVLQELPNLILLIICYSVGDPNVCGSSANQVLLVLFAMHYMNRTLIFPFLIRGGKASTFVPFIMAMMFCTTNAYLQCRYLTYLQRYPDEWLHDPRFVAGLILFFVGFAINNHSDHVLRNLRKPGETGYKIPNAGMFRYVSGANFFGEIVEWTGFACACWSLPAAVFAFTTICNIGPRALNHHQWYLSKFKESYPKERKAIIPFLL